jgi:hypothetical protein
MSYTSFFLIYDGSHPATLSHLIVVFQAVELALVKISYGCIETLSHLSKISYSFLILCL